MAEAGIRTRSVPDPYQSRTNSRVLERPPASHARTRRSPLTGAWDAQNGGSVSSLPSRPAPRVFYVGNTTANGEFNSADLMMGTQSLETTFAGRVTAATSVSPVHLLVALEGGEIHRFNTLTKSAELVIDLEAHVTSLSHDKFTGRVYGGLSTLEVVELHPFTGEVATFAMMPGKGRIAVSPSGRLWYAPVKYIQAGELSAWELPGEI